MLRAARSAPSAFIAELKRSAKITMKLIKTAFLLFFCITCNAMTPSQSIIGTWVSSKELTLPTLKLGDSSNPEKISKFADIFGKLVLIIKPTTIESYFIGKEQKREVSEYKVVEAREGIVVIEFKEGDSTESLKFHLKGPGVIYTETRVGDMSFDEHFIKKE